MSENDFFFYEIKHDGITSLHGIPDMMFFITIINFCFSIFICGNIYRLSQETNNDNEMFMYEMSGHFQENARYIILFGDKDNENLTESKGRLLF